MTGTESGGAGSGGVGLEYADTSSNGSEGSNFANSEQPEVGAVAAAAPQAGGLPAAGVGDSVILTGIDLLMDEFHRVRDDASNAYENMLSSIGSSLYYHRKVVRLQADLVASTDADETQDLIDQITEAQEAEDEHREDARRSWREYDAGWDTAKALADTIWFASDLTQVRPTDGMPYPTSWFGSPDWVKVPE